MPRSCLAKIGCSLLGVLSLIPGLVFGEESKPGTGQAKDLPTRGLETPPPGRGLESQGRDGRYWDPPPGFRDEGEGVRDRSGTDGGRYSGDRAVGVPVGVPVFDAPYVSPKMGVYDAGREAMAPVAPPGQDVDPDTLDPRREIDPYYLRKGRRPAYPVGPGLPPVGQNGLNAGNRGDGLGGYGQENSYRVNPGAGYPGDYSGSGGYRDAPPYANRYGEGPALDRGWGGDYSGRGGYDASRSGNSTGGAAFSWGSRYDAVNRDSRGSGWNSSPNTWMRPYDSGYERDGWNRFPTDPYLGPEDFSLNGGGYRGPWR